jgi:hypothetical protein
MVRSLALFLSATESLLETPPSDFEKDNIKRLLGSEVIESDFKTAVFRFSDDTAQGFGQPRSEAVNAHAQKLAAELDPRIFTRPAPTSLRGRAFNSE